MSPSGLKSNEECSLSGGLRTPAVLMPPSGLKPNSHFHDAPASVFSPEGETSLPMCVSHRTQAPPPPLFFPDAPASVFKPGGRNFPAGVRKPPDPGATTTPLLSRCASIGLQPGERNFPAGVHKPPVGANCLLLGSRQNRIDRDAHRFLADDVSIDPNKDPMITLAHR